MRLPCRYFDGRTSNPWSATAAIDQGGLRIVGDGVDRLVAAAALRFAPATALGPARIAFADGGLCEFDDRIAADKLFAVLGHRRSRVDRLSSRTSHAIGIVVAFVAVIVACYLWVLPWAADAAVAHAPRAWDVALGDRVLETLDRQRFLEPTLLPTARQQAIRARFAALRWPVDADGTPVVERPLQFRRLGAPNAFALPGGTIVVTDELIALVDRTADDDQRYDPDAALATILAHEAGHVVHRDVMRQLVRGALTSALATWYLGDVSSAVAVLVGGVGAMKYSRSAEHAADLYAIDTMRVNGRSTHSAAVAFRRLAAWEPLAVAHPSRNGSSDSGTASRRGPRQRIPEYLGTHPATDDRIALFDDAAR